MFPLKDDIPGVHPPLAGYALILVNTLIYLQRFVMTRGELVERFYEYGVAPARFVHPDWAAQVGFEDSLFPLISYMFMHADFLHLAANMWMIHIFADNVEDVFGHARFLVFYGLCGFAALLLHMLFNLDSTVPVLGASGAIAGVMGAYFRLYPHARVLTLIPIIILPWFVNLPAVFFLGIWFLIQVFSGIGQAAADSGGGGVAWWAHAGGFAAGFALTPLFKRADHCQHCVENVRHD